MNGCFFGHHRKRQIKSPKFIMPDSKSVKVLYIEDDAASRMLVRKVLNREPFVYIEAPDGLSGWRKALKERPDLILMDINLPDISGTELTTKIKNTRELRNIVVVALTAMKEEHARELTLVAGCDGFLTKPIDIKKFPEQLLQFLEGKKESIPTGQKEYFHSQYELRLVEHLTLKVTELEKSNRQLEHTSRRLKEYNSYLENVLAILSQLQICSNPTDLKKTLVDEICDRFKYDRCIFLDVNAENNLMQVNYARGIKQDDWDKYTYPFNNTLFRRIFERKQVIVVPGLERIQDLRLRKKLEALGASQFIFAYLGIPTSPFQSSEIKGRIMPMLEPYLPRLYNQEDSDINVILDHLQEYLERESLYRGGFIFLDNYLTRRRIASFEYRFLDTLFRTTSYMYQNLLLMEELRVLFIRAEKEALTDPLTNLFNYRYFMQQLSREISRARRHNSRFSLIMIDIDHFKIYNDTFGHQAGDLILRRLARLLMKNTRTSDIVSRYGGEEFIIICPELNKQEAVRMAEKLRQIIEDNQFPNAQKLPFGKMTISLGVATFPEDGENSYRLIRNVDRALYQAKEKGRNRVCLPPE